MKAQKGLRDFLDEITTQRADEGLAKWLLGQIPRIAELHNRFSHSISLVQAFIPGNFVPGKPETYGFNCYQHSFGLAKDERVIGIMRGHGGRVFPDRQFVQNLVDARLQSISAAEAVDGDHIVYSSTQVEHAGIMRQGGVESKWGGVGHLWHHGVFEVPLRYGDRVRFFRRLDPEVSIRAFLEYEIERTAEGR
jgi:hypothetical protein